MRRRDFIQEQIKSYHQQRFSEAEIRRSVSRLRFHIRRRLVLVTIRDGRLLPLEAVDQDMNNLRVQFIKRSLEHVLSKKSVADLFLVFNLYDAYQDLGFPVISFAVPEGVPGLVYPNFDLFDTPLDGMKDVCAEMERYTPKEIHDDIYFVGAPSTINNHIRQELAKEALPFNVSVSPPIPPEPLYRMKDHKYLLDLAGFRPWSVRNKYLYMTRRLVIRVSFYNSHYGERGYYKQAHDYLFQEGEDYVHLVYDMDHFKHVSDEVYRRIKEDILDTYERYQTDPKAYEAMTRSAFRKTRQVTETEAYKYIYVLLKEYRRRLVKE